MNFDHMMYKSMRAIEKIPFHILAVARTQKNHAVSLLPMLSEFIFPFIKLDNQDLRSKFKPF